MVAVCWVQLTSLEDLLRAVELGQRRKKGNELDEKLPLMKRFLLPRGAYGSRILLEAKNRKFVFAECTL